MPSTTAGSGPGASRRSSSRRSTCRPGRRPAPLVAGSLERLAVLDAVPARSEAGDANARTDARDPGEPLVLSFYQVDAYLTCPLKYRYAHVLRVPTAPHHAIVYGAALHVAVSDFHRRHARGEVMTEESLIAAFEGAWSSEGFISREHEEARLEAGRRALRRFRAEQLAPGAVVPAYVEREFAFTLDGDRVRGRMDRVDVLPLAGEAGLPRRERRRARTSTSPTSSRPRCRCCASGSSSPTTRAPTSAIRRGRASGPGSRSS